ncbi:GumC family protein [Rhodobacter lacus]|uniref:non-specific protein-tyrosine kinase n=1 Tax=Rhodobacter lacus TaxID=1641972 RepID=A0ABW5ADV0_9RHOB
MQKNSTIQRPSSEANDDLIDVGQVILTLRAGWKTVAISFAAMVLAGLIFVLFIATPIYTATATVMLDTRKPQVIDLEGMMGSLTGDSSELNTEVEVLRSRSLAEKTVDKLGLLDDPEFNATLKPPSLIARVLGVLPFGNSAPATPEQIRAAVVSELLDHVKIRNVSSSYVFEIWVDSEGAEKAAKIADTMAELYTLGQIEAKFKATEQATEWLANRVSELKLELELAEEKVKAFNSQTTLISPEALASMEIQLKDLRERYEQSGKQLTAAQTRLEALNAAQTLQDKKLAAHDPQLAQIDETNTVAFDHRFEQVVARTELEVARMQDQNKAIKRSLDNLMAQISKQGDDMITLQQLTREADASRALYEYFLSRLKETSAQQGIQQADSRLLSAAVVPIKPTAPSKSLVLTICALLGLLGGAGIVMAREMMDTSYRSARKLEQDTGIIVMGQIPLIPAKDRTGILDYILSKPASAVMEAFRNLRTSVLLSNIDQPPKVIMVTSSVPGEGKTTNSLALAQTLVGIDKSVLLVEGDIRRSMLSAYFPKRSVKKGIVTLLAGQGELDEVAVKDERTGLTVILGEDSTISAADLFMSDAYHKFIAEMRDQFDYIVIDSPPVLMVPDARIIARSVDAVLFTVRWNTTGRSQIQDALKVFDAVNLRVSGLIMSQVDGEKMKLYGYNNKYAASGAGYYRE